MANRTVHRYEPSGWAIGFTGFAGLLLILIGVFQALAGLAAIVEEQFYVVAQNYIFNFNVTTWGWIHLVVGVVVVAAGFGIFTGAVWARIVGVVIALISGITNFMFLPYYPLWSILIIAVDVAIIWALTTHGRDITEH